MKLRKADPYEPRARELALTAGIDPDSRIDRPGQRSTPAWCCYRQAAREEHNAAEAAMVARTIAPQAPEFQNAQLTVFGTHGEGTLAQMNNCMKVGNVMGGVLCADGHLGYAQPVGGVIAYDSQISVSGVGFDIACGNMAVRLDTPFSSIEDRIGTIINDVAKTISFGVGRTNNKKVEHELFDDTNAWKASGMGYYRQKAQAQLGTVGSGNHYVDLLKDGDGFVWIGVHFGSRGLGHTASTRHLKAAGGKDGINVPPTVVDENSEIGRSYIAAMELAGEYAYAGREWVVERVRKIIGGAVTDSVHNHHNYAWLEHRAGRDLWVVRKGATPAFPGQRGFVGGSMGDDAVIIEGVDSAEARLSFYSTIHGAGRLFGRKEAKRRFTRDEMNAWLRGRAVTLVGGGIDESPMAYRRLPEVLAAHAGTVKVLHTLRPFAVAMAGEGEFDPWKD